MVRRLQIAPEGVGARLSVGLGGPHATGRNNLRIHNGHYDVSADGTYTNTSNSTKVHDTMANEADFYINETDTSPPLRAQLLADDNLPRDLTNSRVRFQMKAQGDSSPTVDSRCVITDLANGHINYEWSPGDTDTPDHYNAVFRVEDDAMTQVTGETHTYSSGTDIYQLNNDPLVVAGAYTVTIEDVKANSYEYKTDFDIVDDNSDGDLESVDWSIGGSSPNDGVDFEVDYRYETSSSFDHDETFPNEQFIVVKIDEGL